MTNYPTQLDEIDQWLFDSFGIVAGACSSTENLRHNTARMIAEALWPKKDHIDNDSKKDSGDSIISNDLKEAARHSEILAYPMPEDGDIEKVMKVQEARIFHEVGFIAGANWQKEQLRDLCYQCEKNGETIYYKGMQYAIKRMEKENKETIELAEDHAMLAGMVKAEEQVKKDAIETTIVNDWTYGKDPDHAIIPAIHQRIEGVKVGDKVKIYIFKDNKK